MAIGRQHSGQFPDTSPLLVPFAALGLGASLGFTAAIADPGPTWTQVLQLPSAWLFLAVVVGATAPNWRSALVWGPIALVVAVAVYYGTLLETGIRAYYDTAERAAFIWALVGLGCAPPMAFTGWALANWRPGLRRGLVSSLLVGWLWCEATLVWVLWTDGLLGVAALAEAAFGVIIVAYATRRPGAFVVASCVALAGAVLASSIGLAIWRTIDCAAGKVCS